jgi:photosystem II stability/assembly factor-like uncharacterized protein
MSFRRGLSYASSFFLIVGCLLAGALPLGAQRGVLDPAQLQGLRYRLIGPFRAGRANAVAGIPGDRSTYYFGGAAGGVFKTTDGGTNWEPIFDGEKVAAIGDIAVSPSDPNVVYVGTGDTKLRGNVSRGNGVYKSRDAGRSWKHVGLERSYHIGRVIVDPRNPDVVFVAALGSAFGPNPERGIFRSRDGGASWERVLFVNAETGGIDVNLDPANPSILFASLWQVVRKPYDLVSGGPGSGLYRSADGGDTWTRLSGNGLPDGILGKIGVAVSPADSRRVYALIEAEKGGLYRSDDGGVSWQWVNRSHALTQRAWYFMQVVPDPVNLDVLYTLSIPLLKSIDGGKSFSVVPQFHVDNQALWIDPKDPRHMISGSDGGANITVNGGLSWSRSDDNQPTGQFYHVITDNRFPYHVYGGQQDYETVAIASRGAHGGISRSDWYEVGGCEMGFAAPHPAKPDIVLAGCTDGGISRYDHRTRRTQSIEPWPETNIGHEARDAKYRFQWTAPILISPHDPGVLYMASNVLFKSTDEGMSWSVVSPDLTRDDEETQGPAGGPLTKDNVGTEVYGTIFAVAESPRQKDLLWAGSDDGLVHLTQDGGQNWTPVTPKEMPEWSRVSMIEASPHDAATAYLAVDRHLLDDFQPYIYKTADFGKTWKRLTNGLPRDTFIRAIREDAVRRGLLFAGAEAGVFVSLDDGANWQSLQLNLPVSPVHDLVVKESDLVVATHGRAFWILDDIAPLRQMSERAVAAAVHLFEPTPAYRVRDDFSSVRTPAGENPPPGLVVYYSLRSVPKGEVTLSILDGEGNLVDSFSSAKRGGISGPSPYSKTSSVGTSVGLNRWVWDLRYPGPRFIPGHVLFMHAPPAPPVGALALSGRYQVKISVEGETRTAAFEIRPDPRVEASPEELRAQFELHQKLVDLHSRLNDSVLRIRRIRKQLDGLEERAGKAAEVLQAAKRIDEKLTAIEHTLVEPRMETSADAFNFPTRLDNKLSILIGIVANSDTAPTQPSYDLARDLGEKIDSELGRLRELIAADVSELNRLVQDRGIAAIVPEP